MGPVQELVRLRKAHGLNQRELAKAAGLPRATVSKLETGALDPQLSTLTAYARALCVEFRTVPPALRGELEAFVRSGGRWLGQPTGVGAPRSIVDEILGRSGSDEDLPESPWSMS